MCRRRVDRGFKIVTYGGVCGGETGKKDRDLEVVEVASDAV